ncbi:hypothetical protein CEXT_443471 [Caerostris extrusa]|uniref:Uncharacterized protein n=1 Tax=Caerostris extrusa TaxID=172846 RepID=A0AAV4R9Q7_CAEEX|nr:hypothetical protein CEXT_443471 [Caerostris extrusa]
MYKKTDHNCSSQTNILPERQENDKFELRIESGNFLPVRVCHVRRKVLTIVHIKGDITSTTLKLMDEHFSYESIYDSWLMADAPMHQRLVVSCGMHMVIHSYTQIGTDY